MTVNIEKATPDLSSHITSLIMEAMSSECCQNLAGHEHTLAEFHQVMTRLVEMEDSQYSFLNTLVAKNTTGILVGICVVYDGGQLRKLRRRFEEEALRAFGIDYSGMSEETHAGELYIDSLAVSSNFRGKGIATQLLKAAVAEAMKRGLPAVGLLVDKGNPTAESLYKKCGFRYVDDASWGGHPMKHLQYQLDGF